MQVFFWMHNLICSTVYDWTFVLLKQHINCADIYLRIFLSRKYRGTLTRYGCLQNTKDQPKGTLAADANKTKTVLV